LDLFLREDVSDDHGAVLVEVGKPLLLLLELKSIIL
jgi:hypothetical protein